MKYASWDEFMAAPAILGQDPYYGPEQADGLAFSVRQGVRVPPSLKNIFREFCSDISDGALRARQGDHRCSGDLTPWTRQGVLLLNTALTVRQGEAGSHLNVWQPFTDEVVRAVVDSADVAPHFTLWGAKARATFERCVKPIVESNKGWTNCLKCKGGGEPDNARACLDCAGTGELYTQEFRTVKGPDRLITCTYSPHPSPLSADRGFFGSRPFSRANLALQLNNPGVTAVDWRLP
jgi:uracil-DNA glycosylase